MNLATSDDWLEEQIWIVPDDHPYCAGGNHIPHVYRLGEIWKIAWRSFDSMKQDHEYPTERQAHEAAARIADGPVTACACDEAQLREFSEFWIEAAGLPKSRHARFAFKEITPA